MTAVRAAERKNRRTHSAGCSDPVRRPAAQSWTDCSPKAWQTQEPSAEREPGRSGRGLLHRCSGWSLRQASQPHGWYHRQGYAEQSCRRLLRRLRQAFLPQSGNCCAESAHPTGKERRSERMRCLSCSAEAEELPGEAASSGCWMKGLSCRTAL